MISPESPHATVEAATSLAVSDVGVDDGARRILDGVSFSLDAGEAALLRGSNGSGKTLLLNVLSGFTRPRTGSVIFRGRGTVDVTHAAPWEVARAGLVRVWQDIRLFPKLSALENVQVGSSRDGDLSVWSLRALLCRAGVHRARSEEQARLHLASVGVPHVADWPAGHLSVGQARRVAIARALQTGARCLLLDEPLAGIDRPGAQELIDLLERLRSESDRSFLVVEHERALLSRWQGRSLRLDAGRLTEE